MEDDKLMMMKLMMIRIICCNFSHTGEGRDLRPENTRRAHVKLCSFFPKNRNAHRKLIRKSKGIQTWNGSRDSLGGGVLGKLGNEEGMRRLAEAKGADIRSWRRVDPLEDGAAVGSARSWKGERQ